MPDIDAVNDNRSRLRHERVDIWEKLVIRHNRADENQQNHGDFQQPRRADEKHAENQHGIEHQRAEIFLQHVPGKRQQQGAHRRNQKGDAAADRLIPRADFLAVARQMVRQIDHERHFDEFARLHLNRAEAHAHARAEHKRNR